MISIKDIGMVYEGDKGHGEALHGFSLDLEQGKIHILIGPSGCGKTTLLYILAGLLKPTYGTVAFGLDEDGMSNGVPVGMVLQEYGLFPWKTVWKNITLALEIRRLPKNEIRSRAEEILDIMGLSPFRNAYPGQLSGGQRQRVALARIWVLQPRLLLMDEPFSALDALTREELQEWFLRLWERQRMTTLMVTHNIEEAVALGHRIIVMTSAPGRVLEVMDNPIGGTRDPREHSDFYTVCSSIRTLLKKGRDGT